jgi:hypothetical protein
MTDPRDVSLPTDGIFSSPPTSPGARARSGFQRSDKRILSNLVVMGYADGQTYKVKRLKFGIVDLENLSVFSPITSVSAHSFWDKFKTM